MKKIAILLFITLLLVFTTEARDKKDHPDLGFEFTETKTVEKQLEAKESPITLAVDNVFGYIHAEGYDGNTIRYTAKKTIRARSKQTLANARKDVKMKIKNAGDDISFRVEGPFRSSHQDHHRGLGLEELGYMVIYDITLQVPRNTRLHLSTVMRGDVSVKNVKGTCRLRNVTSKITVTDLEGDFDVKAVDGPVTMKHIRGSGKAHTVNGKIKVDFVKNPGSDCSFHTINGRMDINFLPGLSADFTAKTMHGEVYSDFPVSKLPQAAAEEKRVKGKYRYKSGPQAFRIGGGGIKVSLDTMNGNIYLNKKTAS